MQSRRALRGASVPSFACFQKLMNTAGINNLNIEKLEVLLEWLFG
jgi:hypothetical protein